ncbi:MAG: rod-binding protein [Pseudomonadota bacterium]
MSDITATAAASVLPPAQDTDTLRRAAEQIEGAFLSEMLKSAGFGEARDAFGGGIGEEQFASLLRQEYADRLAQSGSIGLAEAIFRSLSQAQSNDT